MKKRVVSLVLALAMVSALLIIPASAAYSYSPDTSSRDALTEFFKTGIYDEDLLNIIYQATGVGSTAGSNYVNATCAVKWFILDWVASRCVSTYGDFGKTTLDNLNKIAAQFNSNFRNSDNSSAIWYYLSGHYGLNSVMRILWNGMWIGTPYFSVTTDRIGGQDIYIINISVSAGGEDYNFALTNSEGHYWYALGEASPAPDETTHTNGLVWISETAAKSSYATDNYLCNDYELGLFKNAASSLAGGESVYFSTIGSGQYRCICNGENQYLAYRFYYNNGTTYHDRIFLSPVSTGNLYTGTEQTVSDNTGNGSVTLNLGDILMLDAVNKFVAMDDGTINFIDTVTFDQSSKTYTFNTTTNNYYYDNRSYTYNYSWTYHINYTSVTYIGQSEEYDKSYEFYYQLPDGRSSADLTAEELEQLNLSVDVINYGRSTDDVRLRSLYHFDGNTDDSSFWNYATAFTWNTGASLTYMESGNFNGALYLDETEHDFTLTLPSGLGSGDFTLQWRMYQSYTEVPQLDSYVKLGDTTVLQFNGSQILDGSGTALSAMPIGTWNELAIIRDSGTLYYYLNGVTIGNVASTASFTAAINYHFGSTQQTYKELDELRVLNYALVTGGANYTPTSVPHDTNLALVLPDSAIPVADEYWEFSDSVFKAWDFTALESGFSSDWKFNGSYNIVSYDINAAYFSYLGGASGNSSYQYTSYYWAGAGTYPVYAYYSNVGFNYPLYASNSATSYYDPSFRPSFGFTNVSVQSVLSILHLDGTLDTVSFTPGSTFSTSFDWGVVDEYNASWSGNWGYGCNMTATTNNLRILPNEGEEVDIVYIDLRPADAEPFTATYHGSVSLLDSSSLNTPTLAVRSDIPVTNYQIGGVRPSIPYKGLVYAMVESGYITSLQIYDGRAWVACDGRIWTGERWIPYSSYNVVTLSDMYDIADASGNSGYEYIYSESGFWSWLQKFLLKFREDLFAILQGGVVGVPEHQHVYTPEVLKEATCTDSGLIQYTCTAGDHTYTTATEALEHDWVASEIVDDEYTFPDNVHCPNGREHAFSYSLDQEAGVFHVTCSDCGEVFDVDTEIVYGYTIYTCTRCGEQYKESNKDKSGLFEAIGDFIADGILWIVDKLTQLVEALNSISDIFNIFAESFEESAGGYPELFGEVLAVMPEDLMNIIWFAIVGVFAVAAWKKFFG